MYRIETYVTVGKQACNSVLSYFNWMYVNVGLSKYKLY